MKNRIFLIIFLLMLNLNIKAEETITVSSKTKLENEKVVSETGGKSALIIDKGDLTINNLQVIKSGDVSLNEAELYNNSSVLVINNSRLKMNKSEINTNGILAHGIYSKKNGEIKIDSSKITTNGDYSFGIINDGSKVNIENLTLETNGNNSSAIYALSGETKVNKSNIITNEIDSFSLVASSKLVISNSTINSSKSEGIMIVGGGELKLDESTVESNNMMASKINDNFKSIMIYNPIDSIDINKSVIDVKKTKIISNNGDMFNIINADVEINLTDSIIQNEKGNFLKAESLSTEDIVTNNKINLNLFKQNIFGNIEVDKNTTIDIKLTNSTFSGAINMQNSGKKVDLVIDKDSKIILSGTSYVNSLTNGDYDNNNIDLNGYNLYIDGKLISKDNIKHLNGKNDTIYVVFGLIIGLLLGFSIIYFIKWRKSEV